MGLPEYWRSLDGRVYRIRRQREELDGGRGSRYLVRLIDLTSGAVAATGAAEQRNAELRSLIQLGHTIQTPESHYEQALSDAVRCLSLGPTGQSAE